MNDLLIAVFLQLRRRYILARLLTALCLLVLPVSTLSARPEPDRGVWRTAAPAPTKRTEVAAGTLSDKIYVVDERTGTL